MESPAKKRSLFDFTGLWRNSTATPTDSDATASPSTTPNVSLPARVESNASAPESPVKRASDTQLASRRILGRTQGPSSKLSQSFTAADLNEPAAAAVPKVQLFGPAATPKRRPGDNPYKTPGYSTISHNSSNFTKPTNFSGSSTAPKNLFRSSSLYSRPGLPTFSPCVPPGNMTQSFPPNTPGRAPRGSTADISSRGFSQSTTTELFEMRIASPPRELTGEALAKQLKDLPQDPSRPGSIYADEFLAHLCPPELDDLQRRQFFCILDLRRLKYSADEVFAKKDWKINILNFAKEYEKNRSLIMLRYGLYEFKTVKASEAVKKEWKQKHGIPDSDDESEPTAIVKHSATGSKRKAEDDLKSNDSVLTTSSSNGNKRARAPEVTATPAKNKRKAEVVGSPDENQPSKLHKPAATPQKTPSATKSVFESIVNKSSTSASKPPSKSLFASSTASKLPNGNGGRSVLESAAPSVATSNIFGHLSDTSKGSPNNDADGESETSSGEEDEEEEGESGNQDESQGEETSGADAPTPQFSGKTPATTNGTSSTSSDAGDSNPNQGRSLFDRITRGSDGQPVRQLPPQETRSPFAVSPDGERSASPAKEIAAAPAPAPAPVNNTWSTGTPIKFGSAGTSLFSSTAPKPAAINFGAPAAKKPESEEAPAKPVTQNLFGAPPAKTEEPAAKADRPKAQPASSLFAFPAKPAEPSSVTPSLFGNTTAPAASTSSLFGSSPAFGLTKTAEEKKEPSVTPAPAPATNLFGAKPTEPAAQAAKPNAFQSSTLFGSTTKTEEPKPAGNLFGTSSAATPATQPATTSLFGQTTAPASTTSLFGATPAAAPAKEDAPKSLFGATPAATPAKPIFNFGSSATPAAEATKPADKPLFGAAPTTAGSEKPSLFGTTPSPAPESKPLFGAASSTAPETKSIFGTTTQSQEQKPLFGAATTTQPEVPKPTFSFGSTTSAPVPSFGSTTSAPAPASGSIFGQSSQPTTTQPGGTGSIFGTGGSASFTFSAGGSNSAEINNPFSGGTVSAPSSFTFGNDGNDNSQPSSTPFMFGGGSTSFTAGSQPLPTISFGSTPSQFSQPSTSNMFAFGASQSNPPSQSIFGSTLAPGGGTSTGTNSPFTFGGASSLATTPATGTPEPAAVEPEDRGTNADGDDAPQEQISLTDGGPGEEDETVVHEIRAKAVKLVIGGDSTDDESGSAKDAKKNPWKTMGVGPLRILKHKKTDAARMLLRAEPRGHVALNKLVLPNFSYKVDPPGGKYVKLTTSTDDGKGLETWMLQVKTADAAKALAEALETNKKANEKK